MLQTMPVSPVQAENRGFLREGVVGEPCIFAGSLREVMESGILDTQQLKVIASLAPMFQADPSMHVGTVEVYGNGAMNFYVKRQGVVIEFISWRP